MTGDTFHSRDNITVHGDHVTLNGGTGNTGIDKRAGQPAAEAPSETATLREAVDELRRTVEELRGQVPQTHAEVLDDTLPDVTADAAPRDRRRALMAIVGIATAVGTVGRPVAEAVDKLLGLLPGQ